MVVGTAILAKLQCSPPHTLTGPAAILSYRAMLVASWEFPNLVVLSLVVAVFTQRRSFAVFAPFCALLCPFVNLRLLFFAVI